MNNKELTNYVIAFVEQLKDSGVNEVVISPGSRSTPLALVMAEHPQIKTYINIDERSAGFFALGLAKKKKNPVALLCTSGTAAANYYPSIIEAHYARVPLLVITADRPHELRDVGAPQAINQIHLYGNYVKWFMDAPLPEDRKETIQTVKTLVSRGVFEATKKPCGPVHLNMPFRAPLVPDLKALTTLLKQETKSICQQSSHAVLSEEMFEQIAKRLKSVKKGLIICGELYEEGFASSVLSLANALQFPILADPLSQLRFGHHSKELIIENYDTILKDEHLHHLLQPELIIRFGAMPVSKALSLFIQKHSHLEQFVIDQGGGWRDPSLLAQHHLQCSEKVFCDEISARINEQKDGSWLYQWKKANQIVQSLVSDVTGGREGLFEGRLYIELQKLLPDECNVVIGNSMPIRDVDTFFQSSEKNVHLYANRGANGIDGIVSTALGISAASNRPTYLIIGDLSFYHDINGLLAGKMHDINITILIVNNNGGGIFSFLPQSSEKKHFETLFGTPTNLKFEYAAKMYEFEYEKIEAWNELHKHFIDEHSGIRLLEIVTNRHNRVDIHRNFIQSVSQEIRKELMS
ncbi:2-succinyl-5-enolpyruvyl-6-hydroxy-3-cyclohexene-1-carboxylic-acid synthase [Bacillus sp. FJAT-47783]|uniref:2-succinyl-5-enolpyruvyl-6-hydroxy-3- cyclohexene-1-carboxylic-acid synthase n=1 Tax=Bacillus sp. FJAT-47783 TaxID=2922712 RepID=UPI001FADCB29